MHLDVEDDDDYEPDFQPAEDDEQILNRLDNAPPEPELTVALGPFKLPQPPPLTEAETARIGQSTVARVFGVLGALEVPPGPKKYKTGINRLAASTYDRDAWITLITRLATRTSSGLEEEAATPIKTESLESSSSSIVDRKRVALSDVVRESLYMYVMENFRQRINTAISWLNEEWYNDQMQARLLPDGARAQYPKWMLKVLEGILPFLDAKDKVFTRFLSEVPSISREVVERVKKLARDPERVALAVNSLQCVPPAPLVYLLPLLSTSTVTVTVTITTR